jgi:hypothetical protein
MDHLTEDARALLRAAREIHAERHGSQTFTLGTPLPLQAAGRRTGINRPSPLLRCHQRTGVRGRY